MDVVVTPKAEKQYNRLPKNQQQKIKKRLLILEKSPLEGKKLGGELEETYSLRAWPYRILYLINRKKNKIFVVTIAHRQGAYK